MGRSPRTLTPYRSNRDFYGAEMRRHRTAAELSYEGLAAKVPYSKSQLHRVETAQMLAPSGLSIALDHVFRTDGLFERLDELVRHSQEIHPEQYRRRMGLEARARIIEEYSGHVVPGLAQTPEYARELFRLSNPGATPDEIDEKVMARMSRHDLLTADPPPHLSMILDEAVLRRPIGGPAVMRDQLTRLIPLVDTATSVVQVIPFAHGGHALLGGSLTLMTLDDGTVVAWEEGSATGTLLEARESIIRRRRAYDLMRAYALSPRDSADFIRSAMEAFR